MDLLDRMIAHNTWANRRMLHACLPLTDEQWTRHFEMGVGHLHATMSHILGAMGRWADRLANRALFEEPAEDDATPRYERLLTRLDRADVALRTAIDEIRNRDRLEEMMDLHVDGFAEPFRFTRATAILHVMTHGVHHRAQVLNMLRRLGIKAVPDLDMIQWEIEARR